MRTLDRTLTFVGLMLLAPVASAHTFGAHGAGFMAGIVHPLIGLDHLLALIAAGLWAGGLGGRAHYALPGGFLAGLLGGTLLAWGGFAVPLVEPIIAVSVLLIGILAASTARPSALVGSAVLFAFALFHGVAHGTELPQTAQPVLYVMAFLLSSALLQLAAMRLSIGLRSGRLSAVVRIAGGSVAAVGGSWLVGG